MRPVGLVGHTLWADHGLLELFMSRQEPWMENVF